MAPADPTRPRLSRFARWQRFWYRRSRPELVDGLELAVFWASRRQRALAVEKTRAALALLARYHPHALTRVRRGLRCIWVVGLGHGSYCARYVAELAMCEVRFDWMLDPATSPSRLATVLVHEATHARLHRFGLRYDEARRARMERLCAEAELDLAVRLPECPSLVADAAGTLHLSSAYWSDEAFRRRELEEFRANLRELGLPARVQRWLIRRVAKRLGVWPAA